MLEFCNVFMETIILEFQNELSLKWKPDIRRSGLVHVQSKVGELKQAGTAQVGGISKAQKYQKEFKMSKY